MRKLSAILMLCIAISTTAQAGMSPMQFAKTIGPVIVEGTDNIFEYSEQYQSFVVTVLSSTASYRELTEYEMLGLIEIIESSSDVFSEFPNIGLIRIIGKSENEFYWVVSKQAGITFIYDTVAGRIIYSKGDDMPTNVRDFY